MKRPTVIEQTSKKLKLQLILSAFLIIIAIVSLILNPRTVAFSAIVASGGLGWWLVTRVRIWWQHG